MPQKTFTLPEIGKVKIIKRRGNRNIRLSFDTGGQLRITLPAYAPYRAGLAFAKEKGAWIAEHRPPALAALVDGQLIASGYRLKFQPVAEARRPSFKIKGNIVLVVFAPPQTAADEPVQAAASRGVNRVIRLEAERILPGRLAELAQEYGYRFRSVRIKPMKRRWGSCDAAGNIKLNQFLVGLSPELIDYVLLHELVHTQHPHHQGDFWQTLGRHLPNVDELKKRARSAQPGL